MATQNALNKISNFAGGQSRNVYPLQMYGAQHSMDELAAWGAIIQNMGMSFPQGLWNSQQQAPLGMQQQPAMQQPGSFYPTGGGSYTPEFMPYTTPGGQTMYPYSDQQGNLFWQPG
jgi:hypothetical protein